MNEDQKIPNAATQNAPVQATQPAPASAVPPGAGKPAKNLTLPWMVAFFTLLILALGAIAYITVNVKPERQIVIVTPTPPASIPTSIRQPNPIASSSAFLLVESRLVDLTANLNRFNIADSGLYPPVLDLPLGFTSR
jgi:hypothetical protein